MSSTRAVCVLRLDANRPATPWPARIALDGSRDESAADGSSLSSGLPTLPLPDACAVKVSRKRGQDLAIAGRGDSAKPMVPLLRHPAIVIRLPACPHRLAA